MRVIEFRYTEGKGKTSRKKHTFEGILPNLERRYRETESIDRARGAREVSRHAAVPGMQRRAPQSRGALRVRRRTQPAATLRTSPWAARSSSSAA